MPQSKRFARYCKNTDSSAFFDLFTGPQLLTEVEDLVPAHRERLFPPMATLSMFLAQVLSPDGSCRQAVTEATLKRLMEGRPRCSSHTSAYGQARARLPTDLIVTLTRQVGALITADAPIWWHWTGRRIRLVDSTPVILADTQENQEVFPQPSSQKPGLGFGLYRVVGLFCLGSGALLNAATTPCQGKGRGEQTLLREMLDTLEEGDIALGDAFYPTYFLLCELQTPRH